MPVEIRELIIRATVEDSAPLRSEIEERRGHLREDTREVIVDECVQQVLKILRTEQAR